jgi:head-tail adaptor
MLKQSQCECGGDANKRWWSLTVQSPAGTAGADGHVDLKSSANWTTEGTIKANFVTKGGREFISGQKVAADVSHVLETVSTNFTRAIEPEWRLVFGTRIFQITAAFDMNEAREIVQIHVMEQK